MDFLVRLIVMARKRGMTDSDARARVAEIVRLAHDLSVAEYICDMDYDEYWARVSCLAQYNSRLEAYEAWQRAERAYYTARYRLYKAIRDLHA